MIKRMIFLVFGLAGCLLAGCSSKLISAPGITGRFVADATGKPIANALVRYTNVADGLVKESRTDAIGKFLFKPKFSSGYRGFPVMPVSLQVILELRTRSKHNFSSAYHFLSNQDVDDAIIDAGEIRVNQVFLTP